MMMYHESADMFMISNEVNIVIADLLLIHEYRLMN